MITWLQSKLSMEIAVVTFVKAIHNYNQLFAFAKVQSAKNTIRCFLLCVLFLHSNCLLEQKPTQAMSTLQGCLHAPLQDYNAFKQRVSELEAQYMEQRKLLHHIFKSPYTCKADSKICIALTGFAKSGKTQLLEVILHCKLPRVTVPLYIQYGATWQYQLDNDMEKWHGTDFAMVHKATQFVTVFAPLDMLRHVELMEVPVLFAEQQLHRASIVVCCMDAGQEFSQQVRFKVVNMINSMCKRCNWYDTRVSKPNCCFVPPKRIK